MSYRPKAKTECSSECSSDGLSIVTNLSGPEIERKRKAIITIFKECGLNITMQANVKIVNFVDVEMNLDTGTY